MSTAPARGRARRARPPRDRAAAGATEADVAEVARLMTEQWPEPVDADQVRRAWSAPGFDRDRDARIEPEATRTSTPSTRAGSGSICAGSPSDELVDWAEETGARAGGRVLSGSWVANESVLNELRRRGFKSIRHSFRMSIDLDADVPDPVWPDGIRLRTSRDGDDVRSTRRATRRSRTRGSRSTSRSRSGRTGCSTRRPSIRICGSSPRTARELQACHLQGAPGRRELGWIQILGVRKPWRGRGVGRGLLLTAFGAFRQRGLSRAGLGVDAENPTGATRLYESVGMRVVDRFELYEMDVA